MAIPVERWTEAFSILQHFERQLIEPGLFSWAFIASKAQISKPTLWRNNEFETEFQRIRALVRGYRDGLADFDQDTAIPAAKALDKDRQISNLKEEVRLLTIQLHRERERLIYACVIARRKNIDPADFMVNTPLNPKHGHTEVLPIKKNSKARRKSNGVI